MTYITTKNVIDLLSLEKNADYLNIIEYLAKLH